MENPLARMCRAKYLFALAVCVIALLMRGHSSVKCTRAGAPQGKISLFLETKLADLGIADPPYTVFNFATEAANTTDVLEDELRRKENKAMRRFRHDLNEKKERTANLLTSLLKNSLHFFDAEHEHS
ncbi:conserved Plasmodium protein, unknown function [Plasmodium vivax]|uniref:Transmembrane protein n=6 Tax=Plasmodium vivax TaxID=5855 RepID=A5KAZ1_PLAVS|nr:hypothetical protein, conserved [Plasmodium vivax]KMZ79884.1 hypothetical protein PVIIG_04140 [Plasmodium vivax India VII]KMZ86399.1 hypothetical protein PVBG_01920 [Plasmodium vivax Brazil I]KMZ92757.1 hypothetical protein PVMG_01344 [Plasmodium vivax Mauritania I]KNA02294.1 hypothetical protein PVNG_01449 [Plasmodium vivax North Korean]EDL43508.1 hypothetical protein, conserved [Plasmodium vivax]|eukprot:XP_001613235.1 hypothetical protein [Plasmodium vivax Sal-1]